MPATELDGVLRLRLHSASQLFNSLDPSSFRSRGLAPEVLDYIVDWAADATGDRPLALEIQMPADVIASMSGMDVGKAVAEHFLECARGETKAIREVLRSGRYALLIGVVLLALCLLIAWQAGNAMADRPLGTLIQESFVIVGWVVLWKPAELLLYDWIPHFRRRRLYRRLAGASVTLKPDQGFRELEEGR